MVAIENSVAFVTGSNRGLGKAFVAALLEQGAAKVYAAARAPELSGDPRIVPLQLDVTDPESVARAAAQAGDTTIVINNAGRASGASAVSGALAEIRTDIDTNLYGPLLVSRAFAPILAANGGGALLNVHSVLSWIAAGSYGVSKGGVWQLTNTLRVELAEQGTLVVGLHVGYIDTDMARHASGPKADPADVARQGLRAIAEGQWEVLADDVSRHIKSQLSGDIKALYPQLARN